jgi:hypothetical protein
MALVEDLPATASEVQRAAARLRQRQARERKIAAIEAGLPTPEQQARNRYERVLIKEPGVARGRHALKNMTAQAIDRYLARGLIDEIQHAAASRYRMDYDRAGFERPIVGRYDGGGGSSATGPNFTGMLAATLGQLDARERFRAARAVLPGCLAGRFDQMVLHEDEAAAVGQQAGRTGTMAARFAIEWLRIGCEELAVFYRIEQRQRA